MEAIHPIFKWLHIIAGITWIGLLYFFNFINGHFAATMDGDTKRKVVPELMPRALYWFRWGAAWTWLTGMVLMYVIFWAGGLMPLDFTSDDVTGEPANMYIHLMLAFTFLAVFLYDFLYKKVKFGMTCPIANNVRLVTITSFILIGAYLYTLKFCAGFDYRALNIHLGAMFGTMMAFNVWFRIWPAQQKIISAIRDSEAPDGDWVALAGLRSKHNTYMSVPLLWTMINEHTNVFAGGNFGITDSTNWLVLLFVVALGWHVVFQLYKKSASIKGF